MFISLISSDVLIVKCVILTPKCRKYVILVVSWKFRDLIVKFFSVLVFQVGSCFFRSVFFFFNVNVFFFGFCRSDKLWIVVYSFLRLSS